VLWLILLLKDFDQDFFVIGEEVDELQHGLRVIFGSRDTHRRQFSEDGTLHYVHQRLLLLSAGLLVDVVNYMRDRYTVVMVRQPMQTSVVGQRMSILQVGPMLFGEGYRWETLWIVLIVHLLYQ
jgi:hypothetical protein